MNPLDPCHAAFLPTKEILKLRHLSSFRGPPQSDLLKHWNVFGSLEQPSYKSAQSVAKKHHGFWHFSILE